jgi:hypothetical protein
MKMIAPCGMNCALCMAYQREKNRCRSCLGPDDQKPNQCVRCVVVTCEIRRDLGLKYCSGKCGKYPCRRLKQLDKRYSTKYHMSMLDNLEYISRHGIRKFVRKEKERWSCLECGGVMNIHRHKCSRCGEPLAE